MERKITFSNGSYDSARLREMVKAYDAAWAQISAGVGSSPKAIVSARKKLASVMVGLAEDQRRTPAQMTAAALAIMFEEPPSL